MQRTLLRQTVQGSRNLLRRSANQQYKLYSSKASPYQQQYHSNGALLSLSAIAIAAGTYTYFSSASTIKLDSETSKSEIDEKSTKPVVTATEPALDEPTNEEAEQEGAYNPETGEINWDCPCLGGMADGPCGEEFKAAFSCFVYSKEEPKGIDCIEKFKNMQDCFRKHPEVYSEELRDDEEYGDVPNTSSETSTPEVEVVEVVEVIETPKEDIGTPKEDIESDPSTAVSINEKSEDIVGEIIVDTIKEVSKDVYEVVEEVIDIVGKKD
ncbi:hypothetical protein CANARDRAFT_27055 [[Candida] arabinofermentans NRRL YB-2248]|uniref:Mitochondrial intermembrane space import and assembly protein 40 n=1 Tax=[Candida] arabinofermentans NRRL YB-2248 TaxID=983967 RepID=A0A1E4T4E9_9ASCO|nr:hypothetical protein CANARDRAFT_27055 [[Candida] arabinofermentans NRRL YB-2248]